MDEVARKYWKWGAAQIVLAVAVSALVFWLQRRQGMAAPPELGTEIYAHDWSFQWMVFAVLWAPSVLLATYVLLGLELLALRIMRPKAFEQGRQKACDGP